MLDEMKIKKRIILLISGIVFLTTFIVGYIGYEIIDNKQLNFIRLYMGDNSEWVLKYTKKYNLDFLKFLALIGCESEWNQFAKSSAQCCGYTQLSGTTASYLRIQLRDEIVDLDIYNAEFNIAGGALFIRTILDNFAQQDWNKAIEIYNIGYTAYCRHERNTKHVVKWAVYYSELKQEYKEYFWRLR